MERMLQAFTFPETLGRRLQITVFAVRSNGVLKVLFGKNKNISKHTLLSREADGMSLVFLKPVFMYEKKKLKAKKIDF